MEWRGCGPRSYPSAVALFWAGLLGVCLSLAPLGPRATAAKLKPIDLHPDYEHDKYGTEPVDDLHEFRAYITSFDSDDDDDGDGIGDVLGIPEFVAYEIRRWPGPGALPKGPRRPSPWITDKDLAEAGIAPYDSTYKHSRAFLSRHKNWYQRGHLCAKVHAWRLGRNADWNTHTVLNAVPQRKRFNSPVWRGLENLVAGWADEYGAVWNVIGPVFDEGMPTRWLGERSKGELRIAVPDAIFRIVIRESDNPNRPHVLAFIYPQTDRAYNNKSYEHEDYLVSVNEIEDATGLDFLTELPSADERAVEAPVAEELWE